MSRKSAGKGRAVLEYVGLAPETVRACYGKHPFSEEEAVQEGLIMWSEGHHGKTCTWKELLGAMEHARIGEQHYTGLREELRQRSKGVSAAVNRPQS